MKSAGSKGVLMEVRRNLVIAVGLAVLFGLGWGLGLAATSTQVKELTFTFQIAFSVFVGSQGILIFFFHCIRSKESLNHWKEWSSKINKSHISKTGTSHLPGPTSNQSHDLSTMSRQPLDNSYAETKQVATQRRPSWLEKMTKRDTYNVLQNTNTPPPSKKEAFTFAGGLHKESTDEKVAQEEQGDAFSTAECKKRKPFDSPPIYESEEKEETSQL